METVARGMELVGTAWQDWQEVRPRRRRGWACYNRRWPTWRGNLRVNDQGVKTAGDAARAHFADRVDIL